MIKQVTYGQIRALAKDVQDTRKVSFEISNSNKDRHGTVLNMDNWVLEHFNANPIIGYQHNVYGDNLCTPPNPDDVMGPGRAWVEETPSGKILMGEVTFETEDINPLAEKIFKKVLNGTLRATSVGFYELGKPRVEEKKDEHGNVVERTKFLGGQELLEFSVVNIPSNRQALQRSFTHHKDAAFGYIARLVPELSILEVRNMSVQQILDIVEKRWAGEQVNIPETTIDHVEEEITSSRKNLVTAIQARMKINEQLIKI